MAEPGVPGVPLVPPNFWQISYPYFILRMSDYAHRLLLAPLDLDLPAALNFSSLRNAAIYTL